MNRRDPLSGFDPLPFAMAAILGPMAACIAALSWALPLAMERGPVDGQLLFSSLLVFTLGDMLGVLMIAPPLLWLVQWLGSDRRPRPSSPPISRILEIVTVLTAAWALVWVMQRVGYGLALAPVLLATCWTGLRGGRVAAWLAILLSALVVLPVSGDGMSDRDRVEAHMLLACIAIGGYLAGSYADAQAGAAQEIRRRDRLLFQAERLKTLRAMSLGVIHEVSQPLSTISIEANGLLAATAEPRPDIGQVREMAALIARKANDLAELVRRLRRFGESGGEVHGPVAARQVVADLMELAAGEARARKVHLQQQDGPDVSVCGNDVEVRQALLNLLRNALGAAPAGGTVTLGWSASDGEAAFTVENALGPQEAKRAGMGIGLIITRAIARAHGGTVELAHPEPGLVRYSLQLPIMGENG
jgi:signal transduction histidine kinase